MHAEGGGGDDGWQVRGVAGATPQGAKYPIRFGGSFWLASRYLMELLAQTGRLSREEVTMTEEWISLSHAERARNLSVLLWQYDKIPALQKEIARWGPSDRTSTLDQHTRRKGWRRLTDDIRESGAESTYKEVAKRLDEARDEGRRSEASEQDSHRRAPHEGRPSEENTTAQLNERERSLSRDRRSGSKTSTATGEGARRARSPVATQASPR